MSEEARCSAEIEREFVESAAIPDLKPMDSDI